MESKSTKHKVFLKRTLAELVEEMQIGFELSKLEIFEKVYKSQHEDLDELLESNGFVMGNFATERADRVYITFDLARHCEDSTQNGRNECELKVRGVGFVDPKTKETSDVQLSHVRLDYPEWQPGGPARGSIYVSAHFNASAQHSLRFPLDSP